MRRHVYYYSHLDGQFVSAAAVLRDDPGVWLPEPAVAHGDRWLIDLHADGVLPAALATHRAAVLVGEPIELPSLLLRSFEWRSTTTEHAVPVLRADLELVPLSGDVCQLSLLGSYRPPLSVVGRIGDRLAGHRVAEACVQRFVQEVAKRLSVATLHA